MSIIKDAIFGAADKNSVAEAIEQSGGGSDGGVWLDATLDRQTGGIVVDMPINDVIEAVRNGALGFVINMEFGNNVWTIARYYFQVANSQNNVTKIYAGTHSYDAGGQGATMQLCEGMESEDGKTVFHTVQ